MTKKEEYKNFHETKNVGIDAINKSYFMIFLVKPSCRKLWSGLKFLMTEKFNYIMKKEEHKNFYKTKNLGINAINKSYFIIFFVEHTCRKLWPRL